MPNSSKTCGPRGWPAGSLSARNSIGLRKKKRRSYNGAALVNLTGADVARPEFVLCRRTRAVIRAQQPAFESTLTLFWHGKFSNSSSPACAGRHSGEVRSSRDSEASSRVELALTIATTLTTTFSASRPLQGIATIVSFLNPQRPPSFGDGNRCSCPKPAVARGRAYIASRPDICRRAAMQTNSDSFPRPGTS